MKLVLIDGNNALYRAYHSLPPLTNTNGLEVGALMGFCNILLSLRTKVLKDATHFCVVFDAKERGFRHTVDDDYKGNREGPPENLIHQFDLAYNAVEAMNLVRTEAPGFEADDLIASYATKFAETNGKVVIVSSDKDLLALLDNKISVYDSMKRKWYTPEAVVERYGVPPNLLVDYLAIVGDTADNIPGVQGMGGKTAADLLNEYGSLENILFNAHKLKSNKQMILKRQMLIALHSKSLVKMCLDIKLPIPLQQLELRQFDSDRFKSFCKKHELNQLANRAYKEEVKLSTPFKGATLY